MNAEEGDIEEDGHIDGPGVVAGHDPALHLLDSTLQDPFGHRDGNPEFVEDISLHPHDLIERGQRATLRMVGEDEIDLLPLLSQAISQQHLPHLHVDAGQHPVYFSFSISIEEAAVRIGVSQPLLIELLPLILLEFLVFLAGPL
jgi:hypothetical protein